MDYESDGFYTVYNNPSANGISNKTTYYNGNSYEVYSNGTEKLIMANGTQVIINVEPARKMFTFTNLLD